MMPVAGNSDQSEAVDYKKKYKALKRKLQFLVYEHESFLEELRKAQRKLLKVSRDKSFLLDRLLQYEKVDDSSSDSEATASSESEGEAHKDGSSSKKKKLSVSMGLYTPEPGSLLASIGFPPMATAPAPAPPGSASIFSGPPLPPGVQSERPSPMQQKHTSGSVAALAAQTSASKTPGEPPKKRQKVTKKTPKASAQSSTAVMPTSQTVAQHVSTPPPRPPGHMTREELERHLEFKQSTKPQFMSIDKAPNMLPDDIFSNDNSNPDSDYGDRPIKEEEGSDLVIDMPTD